MRSQGRASYPSFRGILRVRANHAYAVGPRSSASIRRTACQKGKTEPVSVRITPNTSGNPAGKLADAEVIFEADAGPLTGLKLIGFAIWERRTGGRNVTFPARQYSVNGERRSFALLRPANGDASAHEAIRDYILEAFSRVEMQPE